MPIPPGTKFHGVAPSVDTTDRGSATVQPLRDVYTIEEIGAAGTSDVYTLNSSTDGDNVDLNLDAVSGLNSTVQLTAGTGIGLSQSGGNNVTIDNTLNNVGGVAVLEPEFMTVGPGGSSTITTSKNIVDLTWVGGCWHPQPYVAFCCGYSLSFSAYRQRRHCHGTGQGRYLCSGF